MKGKIVCIIITIMIVVIVGIRFINNNTKNNEKIEKDINNNNLLTTEQAKEILEEKHELMLKLISLDEKYFKLSKNPLIEKTEEGLDWYNYEITNYEEVCNKYLTSNAKKYFDENAICLVWIDNKPYISEGGEGKSLYGGIEFENIIISNNKIEATAEMTLFDDDTNENLGKVESKFELKKENEDWKIEEFLSVDDLENWKEI